MIVADSTPLIAFARIGELQLLKRIVGRLMVPGAVFDEVAGAKRRTRAEEVSGSDWIELRKVADLQVDLI